MNADETSNTIPPVTVQPTLSFTDRLLNIARSQIGNEEIPHGSNWGKHVQKYLAAVGITFPASWCMAMIYWCANEAAKESGTTNPLIKTGGVLRQWNEIGKDYKSKTPQRGSIFIMDFGKGLGHTGIVEKVNTDGTMATIEGNATTLSGSREGVEVCRKTRNISACKGFININY